MERPILFSGPMVRAILDGRKTQTRRVVKFPHPLPTIADGYEWCFHPTTTGTWDIGAVDNGTGDGSIWGTIKCPYGVPGDRLWVRETWGVGCRDGALVDPCLNYRADGGQVPILPGSEIFEFYKDWFITKVNLSQRLVVWRPSIHMFRKFSRINLEITDIRVERVQDISPEDAKAEGVDDTFAHNEYPLNYSQAAFRDLWDSINAKKHPWKSNPWVWVVEFKREEK